MNSFYKIVIISSILLMLLSGCAIKHDYVWNEYPIAPEKITLQNNVDKKASVSIRKGSSDNLQKLLGSVGKHQYFGSEQSLTDGIVDQLSKEMKGRKIEISAESQKSLEISVNRSYFERGMWKIAANLDFTMKFGNGKTKLYTVRNSSPATVNRTYNGAVALAVIEIINDQDVLSYIIKSNSINAAG